MLDSLLVAEKTIVTAKGDGPPVALDGARNRVFLITLDITEIVEQESFELSVYGSADGQTWTTLPLLRFPQVFYVGQTPALLDLTAKPEVRVLRAHWEVNRWGRGSEVPRFGVGVRVREVEKEMLAAHE